MSKRANGEGSMSKRASGTWRASLSYRDDAGQPRRREVYGKTQAEVRAKLKDARERLDAGAPVVDAWMTVEAWLTEWTGKALEASDRRRATKDLYAMVVRAHLVPTIGPVTLVRLTPSDVEAMIVGKRASGRGSCSPPDCDGEALGLHWQDVDLDAGVLRVRWTLSRASRGLELGEPKTEKSRRTVTLPRSAVETLRTHRTRQAAERLATGPTWQDAGLVFTTEIGTAERRDVLRRFDVLAHPPHAAALRCDLPAGDRDAHERGAGAPGHSSYAIIADVYSHVAPAQAREAADRLDEAIQW